ncbi:TetR/AcrR family transcriptional regulator [Nonomuraea angiospora]|uniref:TetR/AcrR family transcriptional repressor of mexJK operon n=1 Tax=Nonomuraea angiospora TaxID=46172 RepID=A0ABR9LSZ9_9ACTN|nr:TetR/AcrR family transcriptional regulator [Nonomuraea angiospora]MBE1583790.1 TetR/AcrR family transcriptional repressor of mexJK operon [Nonomuraea angiospora]
MSHDDVKIVQIRAAAKTLFLRHGFANVSTAALAKEAGVSKETLYTRYPSKEAVLADVLEHLITTTEELPVATTVITCRTDLERELRNFADKLLAGLMDREYMELARIVIAETPRLPHVGETFRGAVPDRAMAVARGLLAAARDADVIEDLDLHSAALMLVSPLVIHALVNVLLVAPTAERPPATLDVDSCVSLFLRTIVFKEKAA